MSERKLPGADRAFVEEAKLAYLLKEGEKGGFFLRVGFSTRDPVALRRALLAHVCDRPMVNAIRNPFGIKYVVEGSMATPDRRDPVVRSVWIVEKGSERPRLVTAYPASEEESR